MKAIKLAFFTLGIILIISSISLMTNISNEIRPENAHQYTEVTIQLDVFNRTKKDQLQYALLISGAILVGFFQDWNKESKK
jgi:hypothetical protein